MHEPTNKQPAFHLAPELTAQAAALYDEGGRGIEALAKALKTKTDILSLPMKVLIADGRVSRRGQLRGTKYSANKGGAVSQKKSAASKAKAKKKGRKRRPKGKKKKA